MSNSSKVSTSRMHNASVRVLNLLKILIKNDIDIKTLNKNLKKTFDDIEAPETFLKYFATLDFSGLKIKKINKKYSLCSYLLQFNFSEEEINLLALIYEFFGQSCIECERLELNEFINTIKKTMNEKDRYIFSEKLSNIEVSELSFLSKEAQKYQEYIDLSQKLRITYHGKKYTVEPKNAVIEDGKIFLEVYCFQEYCCKKFLTEDIESLEILPTKVTNCGLTESIVFEVKGKLMDNYRLRDYEKIQTFSEDSMVIINYGEDRDLLLKRLLKYGSNCKILTPKSFQEEFLSTVRRMKEKMQVKIK